MKHLLVASLACLAAACGAGRSSHGEAASVPATLEAKACGAMARLHAVKGVYLGSQPSKEDLAQLKADGLKTVVSLRHANETKDWDEAATARELGLAWVHIPWQGPEQLDDAVFDRAREALRTAQRPLLVHCGSGNRVGAVWIPFRVLDEGADLEKAATEARTIGLKTPELEAKARDYVARHAAR